MPFIPHTEQDTVQMLDAIGVQNIEQLFDEIPQALRAKGLGDIPAGLNELEVTRLINQRARQDQPLICFAGAGAYEHHIPAAVWELATRGEFYTAYTPYQAEASQGTLQLLYEYQTMMSNLMAMDVSNASLYDGASALAEAVLMAIRANRKSKSKRILMPTTVHPNYRRVVKNIVSNQGIELVELDYCTECGQITVDLLAQYEGEDYAALVIPQPNFFGSLEQVDQLTDWAHRNKMLVIGVVNPMAMAVIVPPGEWGEQGADIACGEGQPLGIPLSWGGPFYGFIACKQKQVRQLPGRIIGRTVDLDDKPGFVLTLQAREQHIRRSKATSNICTNQGLMVTASTIYMSLMGAEGIERTAVLCHANTEVLVEQLTAIDGVEKLFDAPCFHEAVIRLNQPVAPVLSKLAEAGYLGGFELANDYAELNNTLLVCATEMRHRDEIVAFAQAFAQALR
ncbi:Glycine dehydrogenase [decarboxylating] (glycine cleavage system P1 protein) [hydrothermal vent metagenome]|uniref:glycine dehydrogenase (aminomethyl-transferring) n=1 Tax=hydrothermal vent metagenome TaxID=652676 RepID=A0A3B0ZRM3_9ZZZZ